MLNRDSFIGKRDDRTRRDPLSSTTQTPQGTSSDSSRVAASSSGTPVLTPAPTPAAEAVQGNRLIVGPDIKLRGEISDCDTIVVEGRVEATTDSRVLQISEQGSFKGTVSIDVAEIHGRFEGELTARQKLVVYATGTVAGTIRYGKIVIEEGGDVSGDVKSLASESKRSTTSTTISQEKKDEKEADSRRNELWIAHGEGARTASAAKAGA